jgi:DNA-3-methyladenine glycosylase
MKEWNSAASNRLPRDFFLRDGITVARELLGKILVHQTQEGCIRGIIRETESYMGESDKGSHTYGGRRTSRTETMYHIGGTSYIYLIYGMYSCMNITAMGEGISQAVLLRGVEPADEDSKQIMMRLRAARSFRKDHKPIADISGGEPCRYEEAPSIKQLKNEAPYGIKPLRQEMPCSVEQPQKAVLVNRNIERHLADGPGKLCIAMGITKAQNDVDMVVSPDFYVTEGQKVEPDSILAGKRIGIDYAEEAAEYLWRFWV